MKRNEVMDEMSNDITKLMAHMQTEEQKKAIESIDLVTDEDLGKISLVGFNRSINDSGLFTKLDT